MNTAQKLLEKFEFPRWCTVKESETKDLTSKDTKLASIREALNKAQAAAKEFVDLDQAEFKSIKVAESDKAKAVWKAFSETIFKFVTGFVYPLATAFNKTAYALGHIERFIVHKDDFWHVNQAVVFQIPGRKYFVSQWLMERIGLMREPMGVTMAYLLVDPSHPMHGKDHDFVQEAVGDLDLWKGNIPHITGNDTDEFWSCGGATDPQAGAWFCDLDRNGQALEDAYDRIKEDADEKLADYARAVVEGNPWEQ
jgi:hypothetical protein